MLRQSIDDGKQKRGAVDDAFIEQRTEKLRKGDFAVLLQTPNGKAAHGVKVAYTLKRLDFQLGTYVRGSRSSKRPEDDYDLKEYAENLSAYFNSATVGIYWHAMEPERGKINEDSAMRTWQFCHRHELHARAHCIFYPWHTLKESYVPPWTLNLNKRELEEVMKIRLRHIIRLFDGKITEYDLSNELMSEDYFSKILGFADKSYYFKWAKAVAPAVTFYLNECKCVDVASARKYATFIREIIDAGGEIGGIGVQGHFFSGRVPSNEILWEIFDTLSVFNLPIKITEFGVLKTNDEELYARDMRRFYRVCFAHPSVVGVYRWGLWEPAMWTPPGHDYPEPYLWRTNWTATPAGKSYVKLVTQEWNTQGEGITDQNGRLWFRGFRGTYQLKTDAGECTIEIGPGTSRVVATIGQNNKKEDGRLEMIPKIKFCGLKRPEEVQWAEELKADFIGFTLYPKSPRWISPAELKKLAGEVKTAKKVLVFVNSKLDEVARAVEKSGADIIQLHGDETPRFCSQVRVITGRPVIKAFRLATEKDLKPLEKYLDSTDYFLLDAGAKGLYGGTGQSFPWDLAVKAKKLGKPIFLAGGLTCANAAEACRTVMPFAIDVAGGVEERTGVKSREKMALFIQKVKGKQ